MSHAIRNVARTARDLIYRIKPFDCPKSLRDQQRVAAPDAERRLTASLTEYYFSYKPYFPDPVPEYLDSDDGRNDLRQHLFGRLENNRNQVVPWIVEAIGPLCGKCLLEIGCGTGATTVALAEQGSTVIACDEHAGSIQVASDRLKCYGLEGKLMNMSAAECLSSAGDAQIDVILFLAVLEHMTLNERIAALRAAWARVKPGGWIVIDETPNRLWYFDSHTSQEPFFMWLPDDLAAKYSGRTPRPRYNRLFSRCHDADTVTFARWGRGVSYHDFVLAFDIEPANLPVVSCKELFLREKTGQIRGFSHTKWRKYEKFIHSLRPDIHQGFFLPYLDIIMQRPSMPPY